MDEKNNIFRKSSLDKISSPERLNDYIKVSNPSVFVILAAIAILLIAIVIWSVTFDLGEGLRPIDFLFGR